MKLHVLSDLHLERAAFALPRVDSDVVVLAGDVAPGTGGIEWVRRHFDSRPVLYVAGNHEFYGHDLPGLTGRLRAAARGSGIHVLENDELVIDGVRFLGCSLWSDFDYAGAERRAESMSLCGRLVNDYRWINASDHGRRLLPEDTRAIHLASRAWLQECLAEPHPGPTVVITHHAPVVRGGGDGSPLTDALAGAFATDLSQMMGADAAVLWIFGHIHRIVDVDVNGTRVLSNQRGYAHEPVEGFDPELVVQI